MNLSLFDNDDTLGDAASDAAVRLATFSWPNVRSRFSNQSLGDVHAAFNRRFTDLFPRLLYTNPFTSYTNASFGITGSRLTGTCETRLTDSVLRSIISITAATVGLDGNSSDINISSRTIGEIQGGQVLTVPGSTVNPLVTSDGVSDLGSQLFEAYKWQIVLGGLVLGFLLIRR